jgi:DNA invertase Pin-like site-specific DNA recombinase
MLTILGSIAEFEREIMLERQKEGSRKLIARGNIADALQRHGQRRIKSLRSTALARPAKRLPKKVGISLVSVYRILRTRKDAEKAPRRD